MRVVRQALEAYQARLADVMERDPLAEARRLDHRPAAIHGELVWPEQVLPESDASLYVTAAAGVVPRTST